LITGVLPPTKKTSFHLKEFFTLTYVHGYIPF